MIKSTIALAAPIALAALGFAVTTAPAEAQRRSPTCTQADITRMEVEANRRAERSGRRNAWIPFGTSVDIPTTHNPACLEHIGNTMRMSSR